MSTSMVVLRKMRSGWAKFRLPGFEGIMDDQALSQPCHCGINGWLTKAHLRVEHLLSPIRRQVCIGWKRRPPKLPSPSRMLQYYFLLFVALLAASQLISPQSSDWNSTFSLTEEQFNRADLSDETARNVHTAIRFERTNWAGGSVSNDPFYQPPAHISQLPPGSLLAKEEFTNTSLYTLPPNTALSRILFQSSTFNGSTVPASAYVLWPWMPREDPKRPDKWAVVGWGHGTSGPMGDCAPSHIRNLWYQYSAPYILALQGYVVVAPDYAGLGVTRHADGRPIDHVWQSSAHGNDVIFAVEAAQKAFPELSERFVLMGHSLGGTAAWAAARRLAHTPVKGYLGTIAGSPETNLSLDAKVNPPVQLAVAFMAGHALNEIFPSFKPSEWLTPKGHRYMDLIRDIGACNSALFQLALEPGLLKPKLTSNHYFKSYARLMANSGRLFQGPMLILQGTADSMMPAEVTTAAVNATCENYPDSELEYATFKDVGHVPVMYAGQRVWLDWIADRFAGRNAAPPCTRRNYEPARAAESYQQQLEYFLELATQPYLVA